MIRSRFALRALIVALMLVGWASISPLRAQELPRSLANLGYLPAEESTASRILNIQLGDSTASRTYWLECALSQASLSLSWEGR